MWAGPAGVERVVPGEGVRQEGAGDKGAWPVVTRAPPVEGQFPRKKAQHASRCHPPTDVQPTPWQHGDTDLFEPSSRGSVRGCDRVHCRLDRLQPGVETAASCWKRSRSSFSASCCAAEDGLVFSASSRFFMVSISRRTRRMVFSAAARGDRGLGSRAGQIKRALGYAKRSVELGHAVEPMFTDPDFANLMNNSWAEPRLRKLADEG